MRTKIWVGSILLILLAGILFFLLKGKNTVPADKVIEPAAAIENVEEVKISPDDKQPGVQKKEDIWYTGKINFTENINMQITVDGNKVSGVYYYNDPNSIIPMEGTMENNTLFLHGNHYREHFHCVFLSSDLIEGVRMNGEKEAPFYLILEGSSIPAPEKPGSVLTEWEGKWRGVDSGAYRASDLTILPIFHNLLLFELSAINGMHTGGFSSFAIIEGNEAVYTGEQNTRFHFFLNENGNIYLDCDNYTYYCGAGVWYDSEFTKKPLDIKYPNAIELGLVDNEQQNQLLMELTGNDYETFIHYAQFCSDEYYENKDMWVRIFGLRGYMNAGIIAFRTTDNTLWAAVDDGMAIYYFTNDKSTGEIPNPIKKWRNTTYNFTWVKADAQLVQDHTANIPEMYIQWIKENGYHPGQDGGIVFYAKEDMDLDGFDEVVLAAGFMENDRLSSFVTRIYIFRERDGRIELLENNLAQYGYAVNEIKQIRLQGLPKTYLYLSLTNGAGLKGFRIIEVLGDHVVELFQSASATGSGCDILLDADEDGQYDSLIQYRHSYDVLYYPVEKKYVLEYGTFVIKDFKVYIPEYPDNIEETLLQFMSLKALGAEESAQVNSRLQELCRCGLPNAFSFITSDWYEAIVDTMLGIGDKMHFQIDCTDNQAEVTVFFKNAEDKEAKGLFHLTHEEGRWVINKIAIMEGK